MCGSIEIKRVFNGVNCYEKYSKIKVKNIYCFWKLICDFIESIFSGVWGVGNGVRKFDL